MFDTHSHIQFKVFEKNIAEVIDNAKKAGVNKIIACATNLESSKKAVDLANRFEGVYAAVGVHPHHIFSYLPRHSGLDPESIQTKNPMDSRFRGNDTNAVQDGIEKIEQLLQNPKVLAIGEVGMDKYLYTKTKYKNYQINVEFLKLQRELFASQIKLALKHKKSLIIHNRLAVKKTLEVLKQNWDPFFERRSVFHCCEPEQELLKFALENKVYIGIDGDITYDKEKQKFLKKVPLDHLVLETDSPFLTPEPLKSSLPRHPELVSGSVNNEPKNLPLITEFIAELLDVSLE